MPATIEIDVEGSRDAAAPRSSRNHARCPVVPVRGGDGRRWAMPVRMKRAYERPAEAGLV